MKRWGWASLLVVALLAASVVPGETPVTGYTRFGSVNLVVADASSTAEIVRDLLRELEVPLTSAIAEALYVGLVTDTGRFQYSNTTPKALRLAAELVEAGADVHGIFRHVYETVQFAKLKLLARALDRAQLFEGGRLLVSHLLRSDFEEVGAEEPYSEGIIDYLRQAEGAELVALIRETRPRAPEALRLRVLELAADEAKPEPAPKRHLGWGPRLRVFVPVVAAATVACAAVVVGIATRGGDTISEPAAPDWLETASVPPPCCLT